MIFKAEDRCKHCKNYLSDQRCKAFQQGIPDDIWSGVVFHNKPIPGDQGIVYESKHLHFPDAETFLSGKY